MNALIAILALAGGNSPVQETSPTPVKPSDTDKAITAFDGPHLVYFNRKATPRNELLIFLPGTGGKPGNTDLFCQTAADLGYHVLAMAYPTDIPATAVRNQKDPNAFLNFRLEIIEGKDLSSFVSVDRTNSIEHRLIKALEHLAKKESEGGWSQYLAGGQPNWPKIAVSGHSQGGGHAALIAVRHRVARAISTGGPKDFDRNLGKPAAWYTKPATPVSGFFTFNHELDKQGCDYAEQLLVCKAMGLDALGGPVSVDKEAPPFKGSRILTTNFEGSPTESPRAHSTVISDGLTPKGKDGLPVFKPVWVYMLTAEVK
jgi:hypothetical protein